MWRGLSNFSTLWAWQLHSWILFSWVHTFRCFECAIVRVGIDKAVVPLAGYTFPYWGLQLWELKAWPGELNQSELHVSWRIILGAWIIMWKAITSDCKWRCIRSSRDQFRFHDICRCIVECSLAAEVAWRKLGLVALISSHFLSWNHPLQ